MGAESSQACMLTTITLNLTLTLLGKSIKSSFTTPEVTPNQVYQESPVRINMTRVPKLMHKGIAKIKV